MVSPRALCAQQKPMPVIGYFTGRWPGEAESIVAPFNQGLGETGHVEGQSVTIKYRWSAAGRTRGGQLKMVKDGIQSEVETAFGSLVQLKAGALVVQGDPYFTTQRHHMVAWASSHAVPAIYAYSEFVASGGLISYGA